MNRIDFNNGSFRSGGKIYKIDTEVIGYERLVIFLDLLPVVAIGKSHLDIMTLVSNIFKSMTSGNESWKKTYWEVSNMTLNVMKAMEGANTETFLKDNLDKILHFCALFCIEENEDVSAYNKPYIDRKVESFKKDVNIWDFFFLAKKLVPLYLQRLEESLKAGQELKRMKRGG